MIFFTQDNICKEDYWLSFCDKQGISIVGQNFDSPNLEDSGTTSDEG